MKYFKVISILLFLAANPFFAQEKLTKEQRLDWFQDAKLGVFIHWGYYGVNGIGESWSMHHKRISYEDYMAQGKGFTAENYKPEEWAKLFKKIGARYAVLTTKHHDGIALWDTKYSKLNVKEKTPAKRVCPPQWTPNRYRGRCAPCAGACRAPLRPSAALSQIRSRGHYPR